MQRFQDLKVWQRSHALVLEIYRLTKSFPDAERFGIISQLRRAAASVPTNIAEGTKRQGRQDYARFINIAEGSLAEAEYWVLLSRDLGHLAPKASETASAETGEIARMLNALRVKIEQAIPTNRQPTHPAQSNIASEAGSKATLESP
ncbi:MAG TPA: four helix bundle protein [Terriglobia bacterium]|nr:four helix bundle protein [Terriglobia bacterium]